jgi:peptidoglycan/xylan/chitin deacetylase (PgdA/CDA1 family)
MANRRQTIIRVGLETLYYSGMHHIARQFLSGAGAILTFHRVRPALADPFQPNRILEITPEFLDEVLTRLDRSGIEVVSLDEVYRRLIEGKPSRRFVALTFDDGYRDNREYALPILARHNAPFTLFLPSDFAAGRGELWWVALERAIAANDQIEITIDDLPQVFDCPTPETKQNAFEAIYAQIRCAATEDELRAPVRALAAACRIDMHAICRELCMGWDEIAAFADHPLATIGAHTVTHPMLAKLGEAEARREMVEGARAIATRLGHMPAHFSFPVGAPDAAGPREFALAAGAGFKTAVTTRPGVLYPEHAQHLTALPRISVNGEFQRLRYLDVLLSGAPTALMNRFRRVDAA